jgi:hypothetical protein
MDIQIKKISFAVALTALAFVQSVSAATLYSQNVAAGTTVNSQGAIGGSDADVFTFASFTATQSGTVDNISWKGTANPLSGYAGYSDGFTIDVLEGAIPLPGSVAYAPVSSTFLASTGLANATLNANGMYDYNTNVKPFYIKAGTTYRVSIRANGIAPWGWATGPGTSVAYVAGVFKFLPSPGIPVYALNNVNNSVVAPPAVNPTTVTIVPVPAPVATTVAGATGDVQGMVTGIGNGFFSTDTVIGGIHGALVTYDGDTVTTYHGGLVTYAVGEIVNYSYTVDVDGIILAKTVDVYPTEAVEGVGRVSGYTTTNGVLNGNGLGLTTGEVLTGSAVPFVNFNYVSSYNLIMSYSGFRNPTTGFVYVTSAKTSALPITVKPVLPAATVGQMFSQNAMDFSLFGQPVNLGSITASGLPAGLTINGGVITGIPTSTGTYTVSVAAYGDTMMLGGMLLGKGTTTIVVNPGVITPPVILDTTAPIITMNGTNVTLTAGTSYVDAGATCTDNVDATCAVTTTSTVDTTTAGIYTVTYSATDVAGNIATPVVRTVTVNAVPVIVPPVILDTTAPVITMNGTDVTLIAGNAYVDAGAICMDNVDPTCTVVTTSTVNSAVVGTYTVTYTATDLAGNIATPVVRTVTVNPAIIVTISGAGTVSSIGRNFLVINGGLNASDHVFYTPTAAGTSFLGGVITFATGEYVTFTGTVDGLGATHATSMSVYPAVTFVNVLANAQATIAYAATNLMVSGTAPFTVMATGVPAGMTIDASGVLSGTPTTAGVYSMTLAATDSIGNIGRRVLDITVDAAPVMLPPADTTAPIITMNGTNITLTAGTSYVDAGATCTDNVDTTCTVVTTSTVNSAVVGTYTVTYSATDVAGNIATPVVRTVTVNPVPDTTSPVITMNGSNVTLTAGTSYVDAGATCTDNVDPTCTVVTTSTVNSAVVGTYTVTYSATDVAGNIATPVVRTVTVNPVPVAVTFIAAFTNAQATVAYVAANLLATGVAPFAVTATGVPTGMTVSAAGVLSGTPSTAGIYTVTLSAVDAKGTVGTASRTLTVSAAPVVVTPPTGVVSTGRSVESTNKIITAVTPTTITAGGVLIRIVPTTKVQLNNGKPLVVGNKIEYKGILNTDASVTASSVKIQ